MEETLISGGYLNDTLLENDKYSAKPLETGQIFRQKRTDGIGSNVTATTEAMEHEDVMALMDTVWGGFLQFREKRMNKLEGFSYAGEFCYL